MYFANYKKAAKAAIEVLEDSDITQAPIDLQKIIHHYRLMISLATYSDFITWTGYTRKAVYDFFDSDMGITSYKEQTGQFIIFYDETKSEPWCRFTIAHELGHIFLEHHTVSGAEYLKKDVLSERQYKEFEKEANAFARNLLSPAPLAWEVVQDHPDNQNSSIEECFDITSLAANVRINYIRRDLRDYTDTMNKACSSIELTFKNTCWKCHTLIPKGATHCVACGSTNILLFNRYISLPPKIRVDKRHVVEYCARCGNRDIADDAFYCIICGAPLINICSGILENGRMRKRHYNPSYCKYCGTCGSETSFLKYHVLTNNKEVKSMNYTDGVPYDPDTLKVKICPVCENEEFSSNASFCKICGTNIYNLCEGTYYQGEDDLVRHPNPSNARFCELCGQPTLYGKEGILPNWKAYKAKLSADQNSSSNDLRMYPKYNEIAQNPGSEGYNPISTVDIESENIFDLPFS